MSSRSEILARVRKNQPAPLPLPEVPTFDTSATTPPIGAGSFRKRSLMSRPIIMPIRSRMFVSATGLVAT